MTARPGAGAAQTGRSPVDPRRPGSKQPKRRRPTHPAAAGNTADPRQTWPARQQATERLRRPRLRRRQVPNARSRARHDSGHCPTPGFAGGGESSSRASPNCIGAAGYAFAGKSATTFTKPCPDSAARAASAPQRARGSQPMDRRRLMSALRAARSPRRRERLQQAARGRSGLSRQVIRDLPIPASRRRTAKTLLLPNSLPAGRRRHHPPDRTSRIAAAVVGGQ